MRDGRKQQNCVEALWQFALDEYGRPEVRSLCLKLQDEFGLDVNLLLAAAFCGRRGQAWVLEDVDALQGVCAGIRERFILPLREMRRQAKSDCPAEVYQSLKSAELAMERWQLQALALGLDAGGEGCRDICCVVENLRVYGVTAAPGGLSQLETLGAMLTAS